MKTVQFTEFRKQASGLITEVEHGETLVIIRHGRPIAEVSPVLERGTEPSWKRERLKLVSKGISLSRAILEDR